MSAVSTSPTVGVPDNSPFDTIKQTREDGSEFWSARELQPLLGYDEWRNFMKAVEDARRSTEIVGAGQDQFVDSNKLVSIGSGAAREVVDVELTRYGAYMVAMACDGRKPEVASAKTYFAIQTRFAEKVQQEVLETVNDTPRVTPNTTISVYEIGTLFSEARDEFTRVITAENADTITAHMLASTMHEFAQTMRVLVNTDTGQRHLHLVPDTNLRAIEALSPLTSRDSSTDSNPPVLATITISEDAVDPITWDEFARTNGLERCMHCAQGLSSRIKHFAEKNNTHRGRTPNGHNIFPRAMWEKFYADNRPYYAALHEAHSHGGNA